MFGRAFPFDEQWILARFRDIKPRWREDEWRCCADMNEGTVHIVPANDSVNCHTFADDCVCGPQMILLNDHPTGDHPDVWMYVHQALDGRP